MLCSTTILKVSIVMFVLQSCTLLLFEMPCHRLFSQALMITLLNSRNVLALIYYTYNNDIRCSTLAILGHRACAQKPDERKTPRKSYPKTRFGSAQTRGVIFRKNGQAQPTRSFLLQMSSPPKSLCPFLNGTVSNGRRDYTVATPGITCPRGFCKDFFSVSYSPAG